jgi:hypothetical protein
MSPFSDSGEEGEKVECPPFQTRLVGAGRSVMPAFLGVYAVSGPPDTKRGTFYFLTSERYSPIIS